MSLRSIRFRIDAFPQILLAAALTAAAGAAQAQPASATGSRAQTPAPAAPALTPKRSFDDTPLPAATPAATPTPESATPAGTGALPPRTPAPAAAPESATPAGTGSLPPRTAAPAPAPAPTAVPAATAAPAATADPVVIMPTAEDTKACLDKLRKGATANGLTLADWDKYTAGAKLLPTTVSSAKGQPEGRESWWDYIAKTVDDERVADGKMMMKKVGSQLNTIGQQYQVDPATLVAIFGIETNYGRQIGKTNVLNAWLTRACTENKPLWEKNAYASVRLLRDGVVPADNFVGSWSGAFGMTQFIPTSFYELAADGDGDGRIDLYNSLPDALASTANHLRKRRAKWTMGLPAVVEVRLPADLSATIPPEPDAEYVGSKERRTIAQWAQAGVKQGNGAALLSSGEGEQAYLFAPTGSRGPVFLATVNFDAILHYNQSRRYALAVALLLNRLQDRPGLATPWPTDDPGLSRAQIKELQDMLYDFGHDVGVPDGIPGARPARPCAPSRSAATCRRTAAWASASTTRSRPHGRRWPRRRGRRASPASNDPVSGTQGYGEHAMALAERYESISFAEARRSGPPDPAGAGPHRGHRRRLGPDAAALARMGHQVIAVEPTAELRAEGQRRHDVPGLAWSDDALPGLDGLRARGERYDLIMLTAVWMHLDEDERVAGMASLAGLLAPGGQILMTLRHGPVPPGRRMFDVSAAETIALAARHGLSSHHLGTRGDMLDRGDVRWSMLGLRWS